MDAVAASALIRALDEKDPKGGVPLSDFSSKNWFDRLAKNCQTDKRLFIQSESVSSSLLSPDYAEIAGSEQATISANSDSRSSVRTWDLKGAVTVVAYRNPCLAGENWRVSNQALNGFAVAPFVEFEGTGQSGLEGVSK